MSKPPASAQRKADFREIAREVHRSSINPAQSIAAALERAYKRGWVEATEGAHSEPDVAEALPWSQIPPRPRAAFSSICFWAQATTLRQPATPEPLVALDVSDRLLLARYPPVAHRGFTLAREEWRLYRRHKVRGVWSDWEKQDSYGVTTINPLIRLGLILALEAPAGHEATHLGIVSEYGAKTWLAEARRRHKDGLSFSHLS